ncbi:MAG: hypothetical protein ACXVJ7_08115 [Acidimicrobiia bacterium]
MSETMNLDDLELELRKLPGVRAAGFTDRDEMLIVQVQVAGDSPSAAVSQEAARIAYRHADKPVALEIVRWRNVPVAAPAEKAPAPVEAGPPVAELEAGAEPAGPVTLVDRPARVRLLAVLTFPDTDELEVHLTYEGRRVIGRSAASNGVSGAVTATLEALANFTTDLTASLAWAEEINGHETVHTSVVACSLLVGEGSLLGIAAGGSRIEAAARAALHALNRTLEDRLPAST